MIAGMAILKPLQDMRHFRSDAKKMQSMVWEMRAKIYYTGNPSANTDLEGGILLRNHPVQPPYFL